MAHNIFAVTRAHIGRPVLDFEKNARVLRKYTEIKRFRDKVGAKSFAHKISAAAKSAKKGFLKGR